MQKINLKGPREQPMSHPDLIERLAPSLSAGGLLIGAEIGPRYYTDVAGRVGTLPQVVFRPRSTAEVSRILANCHAEGAPVVVQGGMTGLVCGALPRTDEVVMSLERMNRIEAIDVEAATVIVEAGAVLQTVQERVEMLGLSFPLDLGARGSCTIGGNIATNAGGNRVIRYGMMRELVLGLEVVLADGTVIESLRKYFKNNTGFDVKQYFIGSEGTLGVITRAVLRLFPLPAQRAVACCSLSSFSNVIALLDLVRRQLGGELTAFEVMWHSYFSRAAALPHVKPALPADRAFYVIVEACGVDAASTRDRFEGLLGQAHEAALIDNAVIAKSEAEAASIWRIRDASVEVHAAIRPAISLDVSLAIDRMEEFAARADQVAQAADQASCIVVFGHLGDGNLHVGVHHAEDRPDIGREIEARIYDLVAACGGSISAEHGIGISKRPYLRHSRTEAEIALMRAVKKAVDPKGILNPGRIFEIDLRVIG
jgi:FAD/FMN-containing dehydrogenase